MSSTDTTSRAAGHSGTILLFLLLLLIGQNLIYPQIAYPLHGLFTNAFLAILFIITILFGGVRGPQATPIAIGAVLYSLLILYINGRNLISHPSWFMGTAFPSTLILGFWVFLIAAIAARNDAISFPPARNAEAQSPEAAAHISAPRITVAILAIFGLLMCAWAFYQYFIGYAESEQMIEQGEVLFSSEEIRIGVEHALRERRVSGTFGNPNIFGGFISLIVPCALMLLMSSRRRITQAAGALILAALAVALYQSGSRGGLLSSIMAGIIYLILHFSLVRRHAPPAPPIKAAALLLSLVAAGALVTSAAQSPDTEPSSDTREYKQNFADRLFITTTVKQRVYYWDIGWQIFKGSPITGQGAGMYALLYPQFRPPEANETRYAHNFAVQLAAEEGLIGLILYLIWATAILVAGWRAARRCDHTRARASLAALLTLFIIFHFNSLIEYSFYYRGLFLIMAAAAGIIWGYRWSSPAAGDQYISTIKWRNHIVLALTAALSLIMAAIWIPRPMLVEYYLDWGDMFWSDRNFPEAQQYYHRAQALAPRHPDVLLRLALEARQEGKTSAEREYLEQAVKIGNPLSASLRANLADWYLRHNQLEAAHRWIREAIQYYPNNPRLHYQKAMILKKMGRSGDAKAAYRRSVELGTIDPMFQHFLSQNQEF